MTFKIAGVIVITVREGLSESCINNGGENNAVSDPSIGTIKESDVAGLHFPAHDTTLV